MLSATGRLDGAREDTAAYSSARRGARSAFASASGFFVPPDDSHFHDADVALLASSSHCLPRPMPQCFASGRGFGFGFRLACSGTYTPSPDPNLLWVTEFPLFTRADGDKDFLAHGRWSSSHHPFTAPMREDVDELYEGDIAKVSTPLPMFCFGGL